NHAETQECPEDKRKHDCQKQQNRIHAKTTERVSRLQGVLHPNQQRVAKTLLRVLQMEVNEPIMHLAELCIRFHLRERLSLLPHRETPTARPPVISNPAEWKPLLVWSLPGEDRRPQLPRERQAGRVPSCCLALRAWLGRAAFGLGSPTKWASHLSLVRTRLAHLRDRKDCCCSQSCNGYRQCSACETPAPRARSPGF